jgi:hypothetical protein
MIDTFIAGAATSGFTKAGLLSALLTTEGLLFAALSVSVSLSAASTFGPKTVIRPAVLAFVATGVLVTVAMAAVLAWTDLFLGENWPTGWNGRLEASALLFAIVVQPSIALVLALGIWRG